MNLRKSQDAIDSYCRFPLESNNSSSDTPLRIPDRDDLYYPMSSAQRGRCVIINNDKFAADDPRKGSQVDADRLRSTFTQLGFEVEQHDNVTTKITQNIIQSEAKLDHSGFDCFVLCILSHGNEGDEIHTTDGSLNLEKDFIAKFTPESCPSLTGKPKIFCIQACRGAYPEEGTLVVDSPLNFETSEIVSPRPFQLPQHADFFIFYSSYPGKFSVRNPYTGSWFIQDLCRALNQFADKFDLATIATMVCKAVAFNRETYIPSRPEVHQKKQMPCYLSTLTRLVKFKRVWINSGLFE